MTSPSGHSGYVVEKVRTSQSLTKNAMAHDRATRARRRAGLPCRGGATGIDAAMGCGSARESWQHRPLLPIYPTGSVAVIGWRSWSASWMPVPQKVLGHQGVHVWLIEAGSDRARQRTSSTPAAYTATHHLCPAPREQFGWSSPKPRGGLTGFYVPLRPKPHLRDIGARRRWQRQRQVYDGLQTFMHAACEVPRRRPFECLLLRPAKVRHRPKAVLDTLRWRAEYRTFVPSRTKRQFPN